MIDSHFAILAAAIDLVGVSYYALETLRGKTKPNRVTWFLWAVAPLIAFTAQLNEGVTYQAALTFVAGFGPVMVLLASFRDKQSYWRVTKFDLLCGVMSVLALILWGLTKVGTVAIVLSILADGLAAIPTVVKVYRYPETESPSAFLSGIIAGGITLLTVQEWTLANYGFALYIMCICALIFILGIFPQLRLGKKARREA